MTKIQYGVKLDIFKITALVLPAVGHAFSILLIFTCCWACSLAVIVPVLLPSFFSPLTLGLRFFCLEPTTKSLILTSAVQEDGT